MGGKEKASGSCISIYSNTCSAVARLDRKPRLRVQYPEEFFESCERIAGIAPPARRVVCFLGSVADDERGILAIHLIPDHAQAAGMVFGRNEDQTETCEARFIRAKRKNRLLFSASVNFARVPESGGDRRRGHTEFLEDPVHCVSSSVPLRNSDAGRERGTRYWCGHPCVTQTLHRPILPCRDSLLPWRGKGYRRP